MSRKRARRKIKNKPRYCIRALWTIAKASILTLLLFAVFAAFSVIFGYRISDLLIPITIFIELAYLASFYFVYARKCKASFPEDCRFFFGKELLAFIKAEGKYFIIIYFLFAVTNEIFLITNKGEFNAVSAALSMVYPLVGAIKIKVWRSVINYFTVTVGSLLLSVLGKYMSYRRK